MYFIIQKENCLALFYMKSEKLLQIFNGNYYKDTAYKFDYIQF